MSNLKKPEGYENLPYSEFKLKSNGCGPDGWSWLVPDRFHIIGIDFTPACDIHDFCYVIGINKNYADELFFENMTIICNNCSNWFNKQIGHWLAFHYYLAVKNGGKGAYGRANITSENSLGS